MHGKSPGRHVFKQHLNRVSDFGVQHRTQYPQVTFSRGPSFSLGKLGTSVFAVHNLLVLWANSLVATYRER